MRLCRALLAGLLIAMPFAAPAQGAPADGPGKPPATAADSAEVDDLRRALTELKARTEADSRAAGAKLDAAIRAAADAQAARTAEANTAAKQRGDTAWMLTASAFVLLMVPGLALFYCGMVRRKNVLATMMQSMAALAVVGVYWIAIGYSLAFGPSVITIDLLGVQKGGLVGWSWDLVFLQGIAPAQYLGQYDVPVYIHVMFQGMFAIITPALISGAIAERIRFWPFCLFMILWTTFVYCPLAHMVWAFDWFDPSVLAAKRGSNAIGFLGKMGALDFAGGTVVHIAAGAAGLACCLVLGKRAGYPKMVAHPNSMVLTLLGAGLLWFGWFGFNGGSAVNGSYQAVAAFAATQAAAAGLGWMLIEWLHKGKPTALGLASGIVAGLVAVTPASGFIHAWSGLIIGLAAAIACYLAVALKNRLGYDDALDAFGVHGVGGFVGAILTGVFCTTAVYAGGADGFFAFPAHRARLEALRADDGRLIREARARADAAAETVAAKEAELKLPERAAAAADAETRLAGAPPADRTAARDSLAAARAALKIATDAVAPLHELKADRDATLAQLETELATLAALADRQDDRGNNGNDRKTAFSQLLVQTKAALFSVLYAFPLSLLLCYTTHRLTRRRFKTDASGEAEGLDRSEHGEVGFDFSAATESVAVVSAEPRPASIPRGNGRFDLHLTGADHAELMKVWTELCQPSEQPADPDFLAVYPHITTIRGTTFRARGGDPDEIARRLGELFKRQLGKDVKAAKLP